MVGLSVIMNRWVFNFDGKWLMIGFSSVVLKIMNISNLVTLNYTKMVMAYKVKLKNIYED